MTETDNTIILAGRAIAFIRPTEGQIQAMLRIMRAIRNGPDDAPADFWMKQMERVGVLLDSLIAPGDQDVVDELYLTGKISHVDLINAIFGKIKDEAVASEDKAIARAKKATVRVQRGK